MSSPEFKFRGGDNVLAANHFTRYVYPALVGSHPSSAFRLQTPENAINRQRPQGQGSWDNTFATITMAGFNRPPPTIEKFESSITSEKAADTQSASPLGRAMRRVTAYCGNTLLECGTFLHQNHILLVIKRTTILPLGGRSHGRFDLDEDLYEIPMTQWKSLKPISNTPHDSWWMRLNDLITRANDRAFWNVRERIDELNRSLSKTDQFHRIMIKWNTREDVATSDINIITQEDPQNPLPAEECLCCGDEFFKDGDYPCRLNCNHMFCLECVEKMVDDAKKGGPEDPDSGTTHWKCPQCRQAVFVPFNRAEVVHPSELEYWRWKVIHIKLTKIAEPENWKVYLSQSADEEYIPQFEHLKTTDMPENEDVAKTWVRYEDAVEFMEDVVMYAASLLPYGHAADNPTMFEESSKLHEVLRNELWELWSSERTFLTNELIEHLTKVGENAFQPCVVSSEEQRLGNPIFPPGYVKYREFLCEWTARGCFIGLASRMDVVRFVTKMKFEKGVWWEDEQI